MTETLVGYGPRVELGPRERWGHKHPCKYQLDLRQGLLGLRLGAKGSTEVVLYPGSKVTIPADMEHLISNLTDRPLEFDCNDLGHCQVRVMA